MAIVSRTSAIRQPTEPRHRMFGSSPPHPPSRMHDRKGRRPASKSPCALPATSMRPVFLARSLAIAGSHHPNGQGHDRLCSAVHTSQISIPAGGSRLDGRWINLWWSILQTGLLFGHWRQIRSRISRANIEGLEPVLTAEGTKPVGMRLRGYADHDRPRLAAPPWPFLRRARRRSSRGTPQRRGGDAVDRTGCGRGYRPHDPSQAQPR